MSKSAIEHQITCRYGVMTSEPRLYLHKTVTQVLSTCNKPANEMTSTSKMKVLLNHDNFSLVLTNIFDNSKPRSLEQVFFLPRVFELLRFNSSARGVRLGSNCTTLLVQHIVYFGLVK